jgi:hypothetical protein
VYEQELINADNYVLRQKNNQMTKQHINKIGLSGIITKSVVLENQACLPFVFGINANNYIIL